MGHLVAKVGLFVEPLLHHLQVPLQLDPGSPLHRRLEEIVFD